MATRGTGKTWDEILATQKTEGDKTYTETENRVKDSAAKKIESQNAVIDSAAAVTRNQYQARIDEAPKKFAGDFDGNLIDELVARKNLENTMADLGLTDSGLNRSQQTAVSIMRGNADAETRRQQRDYVTDAEQAIDQVLAQAETDKANFANQVNGSTQDYLDQLWASVQQNSATNATNIYNAQEESLDKIYEADVNAEIAAADREQEYYLEMLKAGYIQDANGNWVKDTTEADRKYNLEMLKLGYVPDGKGGWVKDPTGMLLDYNKNLIPKGLMMDATGNITQLPGSDNSSNQSVDEMTKLKYGLVETLIKEGMTYQEAYNAVFGTVAPDGTAPPVIPDSTTPTNDQTEVSISGTYNSIGSWAEHNLAPAIKKNTMTKKRAAEALFAQVIQDTGFVPYSGSEQRLPPSSAEMQILVEKSKTAYMALWNTAYDLGIEDEMAEVCGVPLSSVPLEYTGGRRKSTTVATVTSDPPPTNTSTANQDKGEGGILGWIKKFISDYSTT